MRRKLSWKLPWLWYTTGLSRSAGIVILVAVVLLLSGLYSVLLDLPHPLAILVLVLGLLLFIGKIIVG
jgi:hypothetical protein